MIRMGLVGVADPRHRWFLAAALRRRAGICLVDVSEPDAGLRTGLAEQYDLTGRPDHRTLLAESAPSLLAVAQPSGSGPVVLDALAHGTDVVVAPPVCDNLSELDAITDLVAGSGHRVTAAHIDRGHPASRVVKELVDTGRLGDIDVVALVLADELDDVARRRAVLDGLDLYLWLTGVTGGTVCAVTAGHPARSEDPAELRDAYGELTMVVTAPARSGPGEVVFEVRRRPGAGATPEVLQVGGSTGAVEWDVRTGLLRSAVNDTEPRTVACGTLEPAEWVLTNLLRRSRPAVSTEESLATTRIWLSAEQSERLGGETQSWQL